MPVSSSQPIDFASIAAQMRPTVALWYNASIQIIDPNIENQSWNPVTNTYSGNPATVLWSGSARIQPLREATTPDMTVTQGAVHGIRVQVPYDPALPLVRKGLQVKVIDPGEDAVLATLQFVVRSAINSSYGWNRTIECDVDVKSVA